ncbi:MAG TPA: phasin family protein [Burkholderiales bacterium]
MAHAPETLSGWQRAAIDTTIACAQTALAGAEQLLRLNIDAARRALEQHAQAVRALLGTSDPAELMRLRSRLAQQTMEQAASYAQEVYELVRETQAQLAQHAEQQLSGLNDDLARRADESATPGAEVAVAAVRSSIAASAAVMENLNRATQQFADLSQATIRAAATNLGRVGEPQAPGRRA